MASIEKLCAKHHWISIAEDGAVEMFLDHHALSTYRMCESKFDLEIMQNWRGRGLAPWSLQFGSAFHKAIEYLYEARTQGNFSVDYLVQLGQNLWAEYALDQYSEHKTYQALGGLPGFQALLVQYTQFYSQDSERLRPIGVEIAFGKKREVPIGSFDVKEYGEWVHNGIDYQQLYAGNSVRCYLTGRIDFLMDSGSAIGPMDHKTAAFFKGNPAEIHDPQEGMTGYVYAANAIIKSQFPELLESRKIDRIWMNYIQVKSESDLNKRFKRIPIFKTEYQLEQFRLRQLSTFERIFNLITTDRTPDWNTSVCSNSFHQDCTFKGVHKRNTEIDMLRILQNDFYVAPPWNPETVDKRDETHKENQNVS